LSLHDALPISWWSSRSTRPTPPTQPSWISPTRKRTLAGASSPPRISWCCARRRCRANARSRCSRSGTAGGRRRYRISRALRGAWARRPRPSLVTRFRCGWASRSSGSAGSSTCRTATASCAWTRPSQPTAVVRSRASCAATGRWTSKRSPWRSVIATTGRIPSPTRRTPDNVLTERDGRLAPRRVVPRDQWRFVDGETRIARAGDFEPGKIYELVYRARDPVVVGIGLAAVRDMMSYAKYDAARLLPVRLGVGLALPQTGRFLRHFVDPAFN